MLDRKKLPNAPTDMHPILPVEAIQVWLFGDREAAVGYVLVIGREAHFRHGMQVDGCLTEHY